MEKFKSFLNADDFGISESASNDIVYLIKNGKINSVSVMVNQFEFDPNLILNEDVKIKLHLNLTTQFKSNFINGDNKYHDKSFFRLLFTFNKYKRRKIIEEIDSQIRKFKILFNKDKIAVDGHHHIQMVPWIYNYLSNSNHNIVELRNSCENYLSINFFTIYKFKVIRNLIALSLLKFLRLFHVNKNENHLNYCGMIYSGIYTKKILDYQKKYLNKKNHDYEVALHPGCVKPSEADLFNRRDKGFLISNKRKIEFKACL